MIRVLLHALPDPMSDEVRRNLIGQNSVEVDGVDKPALYFRDEELAIAESLGGDLLITE